MLGRKVNAFMDYMNALLSRNLSNHTVKKKITRSASINLGILANDTKTNYKVFFNSRQSSQYNLFFILS